MKLAKGFRKAQEVSLLSDKPKRIKVGAAIYYKKRLIAIGYSSSRDSYLQRIYNIEYRNGRIYKSNGIHAEMMALENLLKTDPRGKLNRKKLSIYIYRELCDGSLALAKPCKACSQALKHAGITKIYYTGYKSLIEETVI